MKINKEQSEWLAEEVLDILKNTIDYVPEEKRADIRAFVAGRGKFTNAVISANDKLSEYDKQFNKLVAPFSNRIYNKANVELIIKELEKNLIPTKGEIRKAISLGNMFTKEDDMKSFIDKIVAKFTPRRKREKV